MNNIILKIENISKQYRLGVIGTGTISHDLNRWWHRIRGKEDPFLNVGAVNDRSQTSDSQYVWALKDINFEVQKGEVLGIIGKNGAGKSTLLKIFSKVTSPTTGQIKTKGRIASLLEVGTGFHPELTGRENIYLNGAILGMTKSEISNKENEIIEFSGCQKYIDTPVKRYSSGMRVRLAFAVAAFLEPDILVIDEVLAVGDAEFQKKAIGKMQDISKGGGRTILFVSHNMVAVQNLCSRCIVLENGQVIKDCGVEEAISTYLNIGEITSKFSRKNNSEEKAVFINDIGLKNDEEKALNIIKSGDNFSLVIDVKSKRTINNIVIELGIDGSNGERLVYLSNQLIESIINLNEGDNKIKVAINKFPFLPGDYALTINLKEKNGTMLDTVKNEFRFRVEGGDFFNTGKLNVNSRGKYLVAHDIIKI
ncbi:ABC transporter ATP-binding protein [Psychroserpens sp.]|uniref:ABC transporter ATP-binding protein n=1 Tax=Psychroserpens sp. TaxID=2020870 RepID=UPI00385C1951